MGVEREGDLVSVIVPAYNAAATIGETLASALAQTHRNVEVLVVDDGSTDATADIVRSFVARDRRVRLLQQANAGVAAARNLAIAQSRGAYVAPLDADDLWHPQKIALQVEALRQAGPRVGVVYCWWRVIDMAGRVTIKDWLPYPHEGDLYAALVMGNPLACASLPLIRRTYLAQVGGYDPGLRAQGAQGCEDLKLYLRLAERCEFALVRKHLVGYRSAPDSMSSDPRRMLRSHNIVAAEARRRHPQLPSWLFRLGEARYKFYRGKGCLQNGEAVLGFALLLDAFARDPAGLGYRLVEKPYRTLSRWLRQQGAPAGLTEPPARPSPRFFTNLLRYDPAGDPASQTSVDGGGRLFETAPPEPATGVRVCSSLYAWRCEVAAAVLADRQPICSPCEIVEGRAGQVAPCAPRHETGVVGPRLPVEAGARHRAAER